MERGRDAATQVAACASCGFLARHDDEVRDELAALGLVSEGGGGGMMMKS